MINTQKTKELVISIESRQGNYNNLPEKTQEEVKKKIQENVAIRKIWKATETETKAAHAAMFKEYRRLQKLDNPVIPPAPTPIPTPTPTPEPTPGPVNPNNPLQGLKLYNDTQSQLHNWLQGHTSDQNYQLLKTKIADVPKGIWISSNWATDITRIASAKKEEQKIKLNINEAILERGVENFNNLDKFNVASGARTEGTTPTFIIYNSIGRDLGGASSGGAKNLEDYITWLSHFAEKVKDISYVAIFEPDCLPHMPTMSKEEQDLRVTMYREGLKILRTNKQARIYADIGHPLWLPADKAGEILNQIGVSLFDGFSINVSNRRPTLECLSYGRAVSKLVGGKHFVIDTSRNAIPHTEWENPRPQGLGVQPTTITGEALCDALLWLKEPAESDGPRNSNVPAGGLWIEGAIELCNKAQQ